MEESFKELHERLLNELREKHIKAIDDAYEALWSAPATDSKLRGFFSDVPKPKSRSVDW